MSVIDTFFKDIEKELSVARAKIEERNIGVVYEIKDEVATVYGLKNVSFGEMVEFKDGTYGLVIDLKQDEVGIIIFGDYLKIEEGDSCATTGRILSVPVGDAFLGRVVNSMAQEIDGKGMITSSKFYPVERIAPGVIYRKSVDTPLQTGIKSIDALIPIGRGQRELIIGDRGTGKSTIAMDTILNQKGNNVICIYNIIGQRNAKIASTVNLLRKKGAMEYTIVVAAAASDPASMQYISPYVACSLGEYFMDQGKDVLIIYDDLTKHAWAYRQISLIIRRPSGREAYPGDIFYLHSRLLERACKLDAKLGGGSLTALPIIETQEGDVSSYIPTNVISITDGQIFLETDLFNAGIRPAVNVGTSVSRVGSTAQIKAMKQVAGKLKFDLAQYAELAAFAQFESDLDKETKKFIDRGARITELLKQKKHEPMDTSHQIVILWIAVNGYLDGIPVPRISEFESKFFTFFAGRGEKILNGIRTEKVIGKKEEERLKGIVEEFISLHYK